MEAEERRRRRTLDSWGVIVTAVSSEGYGLESMMFYIGMVL